ncbi:MAG: hypothetical protein Q9186_002583 [Xanthomendoza sp. 1 TL-2023]
MFFGILAWILLFTDAAIIPKPRLLTPLLPSKALNLTSLQLHRGIVGFPGVQFYYQIPGTTITLYVIDTGERLPLRDIIVCLQRLEADIEWQLENVGDGMAAMQQIASNTVQVVLAPSRMTWRTSKKVVLTDMYLGRLGGMSIRYLSPGPRTGSSNDGASQLANSNSTVALDDLQNGTQQAARPSSPYPYVIPGTQISIYCAGYGRRLDPEAAFATLLDAEITVIESVQQRGPLALVDQVGPWKFGNVVLDVYPEDRLRWFDLMTALGGVVDFMSTFETFAFTFEIRWQGRRSLGVGHLRPKTLGVTADA